VREAVQRAGLLGIGLGKALGIVLGTSFGVALAGWLAGWLGRLTDSHHAHARLLTWVLPAMLACAA
jgi:hypothetical protein